VRSPALATVFELSFFPAALACPHLVVAF